MTLTEIVSFSKLSYYDSKIKAWVQNLKSSASQDGLMTKEQYTALENVVNTLPSKANSSDVYTKTQIDTKVTTINAETNDAYGLAMCIAFAMLNDVGTVTKITNPEWKCVILDANDKILCGIRQDGIAYMYATIEEIMDCINDSYSTV